MPRFEHDGISHYYNVQGHGDPLIFIHGLGLSHQNWIGQAPVFARRFQVITYDCRGHGGTGVSRGPIEIRDLSEDLYALCQHLGIEQAALIGYSTGTLIAQNFALDHPEMVKSLCLIGSYAKVSSFLMQMRSSISKWMVQANLHKMLAYSVALSNAENVLQRGFFYRIAKRANPEEGRRIIEASERFYTTGELSRISCPILLVHGSRDRSTEVYAQNFVAKNPNVTISVVEKCNHAVATRAISAFNVILDEWLDKLHAEKEKVSLL
ncbi:MAG: alpha/beta hydrolase [Tumebacillaceae bacterium]